MKSFFHIAFRFFCFAMLVAATGPGVKVKRIVVSADGSGDYKTIQGAVNSLADSSGMERVIYIKKGFIAKSST